MLVRLNIASVYADDTRDGRAVDGAAADRRVLNAIAVTSLQEIKGWRRLWRCRVLGICRYPVGIALETLVE